MTDSARAARLAPVEVASCGALSGLAVTFGVASAATPVFHTLFQVATAIPLAMIALRMRRRAWAGAFAATLLMSLAVGGVAAVGRVFQSCVVGVIVGGLHRRRARAALVWLVAVGLGALWGAGTGVAFWVLEDLRRLALEALQKSLDGFLRLLAHVPGAQGPASALQALNQWFVDYWWLWLPFTRLVGVVALLVVAKWLLGRVLDRIDLDRGWDPLAPALEGRRDEAGAAPLPLSLADAEFTYPGAGSPSLTGVTLALEEASLTGIVGPNGSGKSTLALLLAGAEPTGGSRHGGGGLGRRGGIALVGQRSELQMLGETVAEDVLWGMDAHEREQIDLAGVLGLVGLGGLESASPHHLSGGQLQRLSLAGALARSPRLLISDESTAMIDREGRAQLMGVLASLPSRGIAVVHVTHDAGEVAGAERVIRVEGGRIVYDGPPSGCPTTSARGAEAVPQEHPPAARSASGATAEEPSEAGAAPGGAGDGPAAPLGTGGAPQEDPGAAPPAAPAGAGPSPAPGRAHAPASSAAAVPALSAAAESLWADGVAHSYDVATPWENTVLRDVSLIVEAGEGVLITGDNGSGKTTLSRILTGLMAPTWGKCTLGGRPMTSRVGDVALSMQFARLQLQRPTVRLDILSAAGMGPVIGTRQGRHSAEADRVVDEAMASVGLDPALQSRSIDELSGGQMRRVALAGLLASRPRVLILDEPMAGLDQASRDLLIAVLEERRRAGLSVLVISHDLEGMDSLCQAHHHLSEGVLS